MKIHVHVTKFVAASTAAVYLLASCGESPSSTSSSPEAAHDHEEGDGHDHAEDDGHEHEGDAHDGEHVVLHDGARSPYTDLGVTFIKPASASVTELVFELEVAGPSSVVRGHVKSASGATSLPTRAEAEGAGAYHMHLGELPTDFNVASAMLVLELEPQGGAKVTVELPLTPR
jgi:hypothetical protein